MSCSNTQKKLCGIESCIICYKRSFATHPKSSCWSSKNKLQAIEVTKSSNKKFIFTCKYETCLHYNYSRKVY